MSGVGASPYVGGVPGVVFGGLEPGGPPRAFGALGASWRGLGVWGARVAQESAEVQASGKLGPFPAVRVSGSEAIGGILSSLVEAFRKLIGV